MDNKCTIDMIVHQKFFRIIDKFRNTLFRNLPLNLKFTRTQVIKGAIPKLLPTEFIIIMIKYDEQIGFISDYLNKITIENILNNDILNQEDISLIVKIKEIKETKTYKPNNLTEMEQKEIVVSDTNSQHTISLFLYNEQIFFTKLLKKGDYIAIYNPEINYNENNQKVLNYNINTIFIKIEMKEKKNVKPMILSSQSKLCNIPEDDNGILDFSQFQERIYLQDLTPNMKNVSLFCQIIYISNNSPIIIENEMRNRIGIKVQDSTGIKDITLWDNLALQVLKFKIGYYIFIENLITSNEIDNNFYINGIENAGCRINNVNCLKSIISSPSFRKINYLSELKEKNEDNVYYYCNALIIGWKKRYKDLYYFAHSNCEKSLSKHNGIDFCLYCASPINNDDIVTLYSIDWIIDDGTSVLTVSADSSISTEIIGVSINIFKNQNHDIQNNILNDIIGNEFIFGICTLPRNEYRIDCICHPEFEEYSIKNYLKLLK
ncbi:hypothetical protein H8356DRAFT_1047546 [Neocallimastix lanati (nom. inval.)]|uniref:Cell division control protein 24 OB domain-containing protein n=1 Tax=Neocallimastix californiae TaxID=1754190 RepID=A0A1Y2ARU4_9FUNG|nr:hypothetical protein H8356DRAFT_1047546 [Neocallimastix sp. JGI-2020a]ORY25298.1 hypothetical protein LY90DRAFT_514215 [Neocallimastix californiae]|eukprot:ORY25298.1 hypothetical protein LY90DRAFT_514215 [Neocallimastix californiae]